MGTDVRPDPVATLEQHWPPALRAVDAYLPFRIEPRRTGRLGKRPCRVAGQRLYPADPGDRRWWLPFADAVELWRAGRCAGIGLALVEGHALVEGLPLVVVDLDDALVDGRIRGAAQHVLSTLGPTYTEISVSGTGLHALALGHLPAGGRRGAGMELITAGFVACTGHHLSGTPATVQVCADGLRALHALVAPPVGCPAPVPRPPDRRADAEVLRRARRAHGGYFAQLYDAGDLTRHHGDHSRADLALLRLLAGHTADPAQLVRLFQTSALYRPARWHQSVSRDGTTYGERTVTTALRPLPTGYHATRTPR